jgi:hypothetical protein
MSEMMEQKQRGIEVEWTLLPNLKRRKSQKCYIEVRAMNIIFVYYRTRVSEMESK